MQLPSDFERYTLQLMGASRYEALVKGLQEEPPASIRMNPLKRHGIATATETGMLPVPWCPEGRYLPQRPNYTADPLLHAGCYYVQEASSMFITHVLRQWIHTPVCMLDLCAAPGGKSTAARTVLPEGSILFANEPIRSRAHILCENIEKFGHSDVVVTNNYPHDYRKAKLMFDVILADVPCSGEGMFRKDAGAIADWSRQKVSECAALQRDIVNDIWHCLRPGGLLIYSTCTFNAEENEKNVAWIANELGGTVLPIPTLPEWNITGPLWGENPCCRFLPGISQGEGLFMAVIRKDGQDTPKQQKDKKNGRKDTKKKNGKQNTSIPLNNATQYETLTDGEQVMAIHQAFAPMVQIAMSKLRVMQAGIILGSVKGKAVVPHQALALAAQLDKNAYPTVELDRTQALAFLRRDAVTLPTDTPTGYVLVSFQGAALGFVKNIGNRCNNLYPAEWRIRSTHMT